MQLNPDQLDYLNLMLSKKYNQTNIREVECNDNELIILAIPYDKDDKHTFFDDGRLVREIGSETYQILPTNDEEE